MELTEQARSTYDDMVEVLEKEIDSPDKGSSGRTTATGFQQLFPHLGHSRTPSACSAISFTSSILSEPISENYPHSEPETDSRGYEIVKGGAGGSAAAAMESKPPAVGTESESRSESPASGSSQNDKITIVETLIEIDEGAEADTEDDLASAKGRRRELNKTPVMVNGFSGEQAGGEDVLGDNTVENLPHIDSIHFSSDLSAEILSQHSSKTLDLSAVDVSSTHSSKTLEYSCTPAGQTTPDRSSRDLGSAPDLQEASSPATGASQRVRPIDKERIESWVAETQKQIERLGIQEHPGGDLETQNVTCGVLSEKEDDDDGDEEDDDEDEDDDGEVNSASEPTLSDTEEETDEEEFLDKHGGFTAEEACRSKTDTSECSASIATTS